MAVVGVVAILLVTGLVGHLFYRAWAPARENASWGETLVVQVLVGVLLVGWPALLLAEVGLFSLPRLLLVLLVAGALLLGLRWRQVLRWRWPAVRPGKEALLPLAIWVGAAVLLIWPGERLLGGNDPGVYLGLGASIARTGGIVLYDPLLAALPERSSLFPLHEHIGQVWLLPGLYVTDPAAGQITPQFLHLFPTWLALFQAAGGSGALLAAPALFPLLGLACCYLALRRTAGRWAAAVAMALLALNPATVWFAREPMAETLALALLMGGWYLFDRALAEPGRQDLAAWAALALGQVALCKVELLGLPFLMGLYLALRAAGRPFRAAERTFLFLYALPLVHALLHLATIARPYLETFTLAFRAIGVTVLTPGRVLLVLAGGGVLVGTLLVWRGRLLTGLRRLLDRPTPLRWGAAGAWLLLALYAAAIRPWLSPAWVLVEGQQMPFNDRLTFLRLSWYVAPVGLVLGVAGLAWWILRRANGPALPFLGAFGLELALYIHRTMDPAYHFWMLRRYLPLVLPFLTLGIAVAVGRVRRAPLGRAVRRGGAALLLGLLLGHAVQADGPWAARRELAGLLPALEKLAWQLPEGTPVFVRELGVELATPLRLIWGREAFALPGSVSWEEVWELLRRWPPDRADSYLLVPGVPEVLPGGFALEEAGRLELAVLRTEQTIETLPRQAVPVRSFQTLLHGQRRAEDPAALSFSLTHPLWTGRCWGALLSRPTGPLLLRLEAAGFRPEGWPPAQVQVSWNGRPVAGVPLERSWEMHAVTATLVPPAGPSEAGDVRLEFCVDTWNPRSAGYSDDPRDLGILLQSLVVREQD